MGLNKISDTVKQVEELQKSLATKQRELDEKNELANQKLKQMVNIFEAIDDSKPNLG